MRYSLPFFFSISLFALSACSTGAPNFVPRGYSSYDQTYKSVEGKKANSVGYEYSNEKNKTVTNRIQGISGALVSQLDENLSFENDRIYLEKPKDSVFYNTFDHALRNELISRGYIVEPQKTEQTRNVSFVAHHAKAPCTNTPVKGTVESTPLYLALAVDVDRHNNPAHIVGGVYDAPIYGGFSPTGNVKINQNTEKPDDCD